MSNRILTFLYHEVTNNPNSTGFQRKSALPYKHSEKEFIDNIEIILKNNENFGTLKDLHTLKQDTVFFTFDDGGKSAMYIADVLDKHNIKGHFFITTSLIGDEYFLTKEEILELYNRGHIIGSHSHTHPNVFKSLSYQEMLFEWRKSKEILELILNTAINSCSIPGGDVNNKAYQAAIEAGYRYIFNSEPSVHVQTHNKAYIIGRICPKTGTSYKKIDNYSRFKNIYQLRLIRFIKNTLKRIIYPVYKTIHNARKHKG